MSRTIKFYDTTLRDGEQTPFVVFSVEQKLLLCHALAELGIDIIEVGFPAASDSEMTAVSRAAREIRGPVIAGLARSRVSDVDATAKALENSDKVRISIV